VTIGLGVFGWLRVKVCLFPSHLTRLCECCKDDIQSLWETANFDPQPTKNP